MLYYGIPSAADTGHAPTSRVSKLVLVALFSVTAALPALAQDAAQPAATVTQQTPGVVACTDLPTGELSQEDLARLVPEGSPGKVRIRWRTESQEECYGFNIHRTDSEGGEFKKINRSIIPGEGSTNIPMDYCYEDNTAERVKTYFYYIDEVSNQGVVTKLEDTLGPDGKGTRVKVKTIEEEREWLKRRALGDSAPTTATATETTEPVKAATPQS